MARIADLEQQIRRLVNAPRRHLAVFQDRTAYQKLCSCLDVIGDTELAFHASEQMPAGGIGANYVFAYGFLQALFLQQDAVKHLYEALQLKGESDPLLTEIREIRNDAIGHPTKRGRGKGDSFSRISRSSLSKSGFELITVTPNGSPPRFRHVSFKSLLDTQHAQLARALEALLQALRKEEMDHRQQFRDEKLAALFPDVLHYYFEKIYEAARGPDAWEYGAGHVALISDVVVSVKAALTRRRIDGAYQGLEYQITLLEYPLAQLAKYFADKGEGRLNPKDAEIFTSFVEHEVSKLQEMAGELDAEYETEPD